MYCIDNYKLESPYNQEDEKTGNECRICGGDIEDHKTVCDYCKRERKRLTRKAYTKVFKTIMTATTIEQLQVAKNLYMLFKKQFSISYHFENLISKKEDKFNNNNFNN